MAENIRNELEEKKKLLISQCLEDIKVKLSDEFDRNFEREAFFTEKWKRRRYNDDESRSMLVRSGSMRRSITANVEEQKKVVFTSSSPYAAIHNEGGEIMVTRKMKRFFRYQFYKTSHYKNKFKRSGTGERRELPDGGFYNIMKSMDNPSDEALFWGYMALKKVGSKIKIPKRQFIGKHPQVEQIISDIITSNYNEIFK